MNVFDFDNVKAEKANAMQRYNRLQIIKKLFRFIELCIGLVLLSWVSTRLPFFVKLSGEYFRQLNSVIVSPFFIFIISNLIVLTLLFKSGKSPITEETTTLYEEFVIQSSSEENIISSPVTEPEQIVYEDKEMILEVTEKGLTKTFRRSQSANLGKNLKENNGKKLRRSETEKCRKVEDHGGEAVAVTEERVYVIDEMSNEEFQRAVEAFIAKQVEFRQQEKLSIVCSS